jgi:integrase
MTARSIAHLRPPALGQVDYWDADTPGFGIRVSAGGRKAWVAMYRRGAVKRRFTIGTYPTLSLPDAREKARKALQAVQYDGADPAADKIRIRAAETVAELANEWIKRHGESNKAPRTLGDDRSMLKNHILPEIGALKAAEVTKRDVIRLLDIVAAKTDARLKSNNRKNRRKLTHRPNRVFELVRAIFRWAVGRDLLKFDPTLGVKPPIKKEKPRGRELSPGEIQKLWQALSRAPQKRAMKRGPGDFPMTRATALTLKLALVTAQRIGEVAGIEISELELNDTAPIWTVPGERSKNRQPNRVPLSPLGVQVVSEARQLAGNSSWLFPSPNDKGPIHSHAPTKALQRARQAIGLDDFRIHDLRRTAASRMAEMGISPHTISLVLNHVSARQGTITGKVYVQYSYDREKRDALNKWGSRLEQIIAVPHPVNVISLVS